MSKVVFLDIDGTIRNFDGTIPESCVSAIKKARENGHKVCICSGRPLCQVEQRILDIGFDGVVSSSGAYVEYEGKCISHQFFEGEEIRELFDYLASEKCMTEFQRCEASIVLDEVLPDYLALQEKMMESMKKFMPEGKKPRKLVENVQHVPTVDEIGPVEKLLFFSDHISHEMLNERFGHLAQIVALSIPGGELFGGELTPAAVDKAEGIRCIMKAGGFGEEDTIGIGDSANDIPMLKMAAVGVAMGNASKEAKEAADYVTTPLMEDGIMNAFVKLGLI